MRVLIVAAAALHRDGLAQALERWEHVRVIASVPSVDDAVMHAQAAHPDIGILELHASVRVEAARAIVRASPTTRLIALLAPDEQIDVIASAEAGIMGCQSLESRVEELVQLLDRVTRGEFACTPLAAGRLAWHIASLSNHDRPARATACPRTDLERLTKREREVVSMLERGLSNKQIARALTIELATVKNHVHSILEKLEVETRGAAVAAVARRPSAAYQPGFVGA
jgi:DNA-binding NarL/FixJ family response regulator